MIELETKGEQLLTVAEASRVLRLGMTRTKELIAAGEVRSVLIGERSRRVPMAAIRDFVGRLLDEQDK